MSYTRREFGKLALAGLPAAAVLGSSESIFGALRAGREAELADQRRADRHDHLQLSQHARSERGSDAQVHRRLRHQRDRADGRTGRELCRRADAGRGARRRPADAAGAAAAARRRRGRRRREPPPGAKTGSWNGKTCVVPSRGGGRRTRRAGGGGGGGGRAR